MHSRQVQFKHFDWHCRPTSYTEIVDLTFVVLVFNRLNSKLITIGDKILQADFCSQSAGSLCILQIHQLNWIIVQPQQLDFFIFDHFGYHFFLSLSSNLITVSRLSNLHYIQRFFFSLFLMFLNEKFHNSLFSLLLIFFIVLYWEWYRLHMLIIFRFIFTYLFSFSCSISLMVRFLNWRLFLTTIFH
jgi:hypothetical protein